MPQNKKVFLITVLLIGLVFPLIPSLTVIEMFFLLIPFALVFAVTLIYLIVSLLNKQMDSRKAVFAFSILPTFIFSQLLSSFLVDKIQRLRSDHIIAELTQIKAERGTLPEQYCLIAGIEYRRLNDKEHFVIEYSRGFMITEKYYSEDGNWESYGWHD